MAGGHAGGVPHWDFLGAVYQFVPKQGDGAVADTQCQGQSVLLHPAERFLSASPYREKVQGAASGGGTAWPAFYFAFHEKARQFLVWHPGFLLPDGSLFHKDLGDFRGGTVLPQQGEHRKVSGHYPGVWWHGGEGPAMQPD